MWLRLDTTARRIDVPARKLLLTGADGKEELLAYDKLIVGTGALPVRPSIGGLAGPGALGAADGVHLLHSMGDTFAVMRTLAYAAPGSAVIVGGGYIGLEMADALTVRGLQITQMEQLEEVLPTIDPKTPLKDLLPTAPKGSSASGPLLGDDLTKVPEVRLHMPPKSGIPSRRLVSIA